MQAKKRSKRLNSVVAIRLSEAQAQRLSARAEQSGYSSSEWGRQMLVQALDGSFDTRLLLSETLALRKVILALQLDMLQGQIINEQRIRSIVENADITKFAMAENRINAFRSQMPNE